jgi:hypothetical protein
MDLTKVFIELIKVKDEKFMIDFYAPYAIFTIGKAKSASIYIDKDSTIGNIHARFL